jgi:cytidylate kinase
MARAPAPPVARPGGYYSPEVAPDRFTVRELIAEAERELALRRNVYARQVLAGRMSQGEADRRINLQAAICLRLSRTAHV